MTQPRAGSLTVLFILLLICYVKRLLNSNMTIKPSDFKPGPGYSGRAGTTGSESSTLATADRAIGSDNGSVKRAKGIVRVAFKRIERQRNAH